MEDLSRHLPLSRRSGTDESAATTDRRDDVARVRVRQADVVEAWNPGRAASLRAEADRIRGGRRLRIRHLSEAVRELAVDASDLPLALPARITGAVALHLSSRAPFDRRAVVSGHTVRAIAAGPDHEVEWEFGRGPVLEGSADTIVRFLLGLADAPPTRPVSSR